MTSHPPYTLVRRMIHDTVWGDYDLGIDENQADIDAGLAEEAAARARSLTGMAEEQADWEADDAQ